MHAFIIVATVVAWLIAFHWTRITLTALRKLPRVPDLLDPRYDPSPDPPANTDLPAVTVIVPARNEAVSLEATLRSLLAQSIPLDIIAINDRSTDQTGAIMARLAAEPIPQGKSLTVLRVEILPEGWMGKTHAMAMAARQTATPWLLFTDGDILFRPDALERALRFAEASQADHVPLALSLILKSCGERLMITVLQCFSLLTFRPWKIPDPAAKHDSVGIGGFNLIRASVYQGIGGFESLRMEVLEDLRLGFEVKRQGFRQQIVFGRDIARVHWASGAWGMAHNLTKNFFAVFRFRPVALFIGAVVLAVLLWVPFLGLFGPWPMRSACLLTLGAFVLGHRYSSRHFTAIPMVYLLTLPVGTALLVYSLLRSMAFTLTRGGVVWRGTFYPLKDLRRHAGPLR